MHSTLVLYQMSNHRLFSEIDVNQASGRFVVLDPMDRNHLLYLTEKSYLDYSRVALSNDSTLVVLARPGEDIGGLQSQSSASAKADSTTSSSDNKRNPLSMKGVFRPHFFEEIGISRQSLQTVYGLDCSQISEEEVHQFVSDFVTEIQSTMSTDSVDKLIRSAKKIFATWIFPVKPGGEFGFLALKDRNIRHLIKHWGGILSVRFGFSLTNLSHRISILQIAQHLYLVTREQGLDTAILRMKVAVLCINTYLGGKVLKDTRHLGAPVQLTHGLPSFLPRRVRQSIRDHNVSTVRLYQSLLTAYKAIEGTWYYPDFSTISNSPFTGSLDPLSGFLVRFWKWVNTLRPGVRFPDLSGGQLPFSLKSGVNHKVTPFSSYLDALAWTESGDSPILLEFLSLVRNTHLANLFFATLNSVSRFPEAELYRHGGRFAKDPEGLALGKLALKREAAGKVRIFAIVDWWTQCALYPLHKWLFSILRAIPMDATFDQEGSVSSFHREFKGSDFFSYDLSAATDNIPVLVTERILSYALGPSVARVWKLLLVDRPYELPAGCLKNPGDRQVIKYGRGQPIGALSSWAALALTHHFLVQLAADRVRIFPFKGYRVLGDDIVIAGSRVAEAYQEVCAEYSIPINTKGVISFAKDTSGKTLFNFANQVLWGDDNISPISLREEIKVETLASRVESLLRLYRRGILPLSSSLFANLAKFGAVQISKVSTLLQSMTQGEIPGQIRGLIAQLLYPTLLSSGDILPSGILGGNEGAPFYRTFASLYGSAKALYDGSATSPPDSYYGPIPEDSPVRKYWGSLASELTRRLNSLFCSTDRGPSYLWSHQVPSYLRVKPDSDIVQMFKSDMSRLNVPLDSLQILVYNEIILHEMMFNCLPSDWDERYVEAGQLVRSLNTLIYKSSEVVTSSAEIATSYLKALQAVDRLTAVPNPFTDQQYTLLTWYGGLELRYGVRLLESSEEARRVERLALKPCANSDPYLYALMMGEAQVPDSPVDEGGTEGLDESLWTL